MYPPFRYGTMRNGNGCGLCSNLRYNTLCWDEQGARAVEHDLLLMVLVGTVSLLYWIEFSKDWDRLEVFRNGG